MVKLPDLVQNFLETSVDHQPDKVALIYKEQRFTYAEIEASANRFAHALITAGIKRGERFAIYLPNSIATVIGIFGALKAGACFVVINPSTKLDKLIKILNNCQARALLFDMRKIDLVPKIQQGCPSLANIIFSQNSTHLSSLSEELFLPILDIETIEKSFSADRPPAINIDLDLACLIYTSGSSGEPKGVMSDHSNVTFATSAIIQYLENSEEDVIINVLPLSFDYGLYQLLMAFKFCGTLVLERTFTYPVEILRRIETERVTGFPGVPTIFSILLRMDLSSYDFSSLRYITNTAAALPPSQIQQLLITFPRTKIYSMYGLTETKRTLYLPPEQIKFRPNSVGIPIPGTEAWIEDENGNRLQSGEIGELVVRGRHVMRGYWRDEQATAEHFRTGQYPEERLCYTGDLFRMDDDGFFYFISRKDDMLKCRGEKVSPLEIEKVLYSFPGVNEAAVIGSMDPILGEVPIAFVASEDDKLTVIKLLAHCRDHLEDFMVPGYIVIKDNLPKTLTGKIDKRMLMNEEKNHYSVKIN